MLPVGFTILPDITRAYLHFIGISPEAKPDLANPTAVFGGDGWAGRPPIDTEFTVQLKAVREDFRLGCYCPERAPGSPREIDRGESSHLKERSALPALPHSIEFLDFLFP
jgi:hypothetical protein